MKVYKSVIKKLFSQKVSLEDLLQKMTPLSVTEIQNVVDKGGVWIQKNSRGKILRIRSLKEMLSSDDFIQVFYDPNVLKLPTPKDIELVYENQNYGVWIKPAGVVPQGSQASDHASLLRYVEIQKRHEVFLVHRLDRETTGLMIIAYNSKSAARLSELFQNNQIKKEYETICLGTMGPSQSGTIDASLDDKKAVTHFKVIESSNNQSLLKVTIETGRLHQIRRHLDFIGHPVMGDPKYGKGNKNRDGLKLVALSLTFIDPWLNKEVGFELPQKYRLKLN